MAKNNQREIEYKLASVEAEIEGLKEFIETEKARKLVPVVRRTGGYKGEVIDLTPRQYRQLTGKIARSAILRRGKVPWEYALDELAKDLGYPSDESLKKAIEDLVKKQRRLERLKHEGHLLREELKMPKKEEPKRVKVPVRERVLKPALKFDKKRINIDGKVTAHQITSGKKVVGYIVAFPPTYGIYETANGLDIRKRPLGGTRSVKKAKEIAKEKLGRKT